MSASQRKERSPANAFEQGRTLPASSSRRPLAPRFTHREVADLSRECAVIAWPVHAAKQLAIAADLTPKGGQAITQGKNAMSLTTFLNAWHGDPQFRAAAKLLLLMEGEIDPDMEKFMSAAMQAYSKVRGG